MVGRQGFLPGMLLPLKARWIDEYGRIALLTAECLRARGYSSLCRLIGLWAASIAPFDLGCFATALSPRSVPCHSGRPGPRSGHKAKPLILCRLTGCLPAGRTPAGRLADSAVIQSSFG